MDDRYQFQPWYIKGYRYLRYRPPSLFEFAWIVVRWLFMGAPPDGHDDPGWELTRWQTLRLYWDICKGSCQCRMRYVWSADELASQLSTDAEPAPPEPEGA